MAKLYAAITNESGKIKGMGGNEYLDIDISVSNTMLCGFTLRHTDELPDGESGWALYDSGDEAIYWIADKEHAKDKG